MGEWPLGRAPARAFANATVLSHGVPGTPAETCSLFK